MTLVEVMVTAAIVSGIALTMSMMMSRMTRTNQQIKNQVALVDLERRIQSAVSNPRLVLASAFLDDSGTKVDPSPSDPGNICTQVDAEQAWQDAPATGKKVLTEKMMNPKLALCLDDSRRWKSDDHLTNIKGNCTVDDPHFIGKPGSSIQPIYEDREEGVKDCVDMAGTGWAPFILADEGGRELTGFYSYDGRLGVPLSGAAVDDWRTSPVLKDKTQAALYPLLVQAFFYAQCPLVNGVPQSPCIKADTLNFGYSIIMTKDGLERRPAGTMPLRNRGLGVKLAKASDGTLTLAAAIDPKDSKFTVAVNAILAKKGGSGGTCDLNVEIAQADPSGTGIKCVPKEEFLKGLSKPCGDSQEWSIGADGKVVCNESKKMNSCRTVEAKAIGSEIVQKCFQREDVISRPWLSQSACAPNSAVESELRTKYGADLLTLTLTTKVVQNSSDSSNTCGVAGSGCSSCSTHGHSICRYVGGTQSPFDLCLRGAKCQTALGGPLAPDTEVVIVEQTSEICRAVPRFVFENPAITSWNQCSYTANIKKNEYPVYAYSRSTSVTPPNCASGFEAGGQTISDQSARAAIELHDAEAQRLFTESDVLTFTLPVCAADEEAVSGGGSCPNGKIALSKRYGGVDKDAGGAAVNGESAFPRNWVLGCLGVKEVLDRAMAPGNAFPLKISAQCCKNGKSDNAMTNASGPGQDGNNQFFLSGSNHPLRDCTLANGVVEKVAGISVCRFQGNHCPTGWDKYPFMRTLNGGRCPAVQDQLDYGCSLSKQDGVLPQLPFGINPFQRVQIKNVGPLLSACGYYYTYCSQDDSYITEIGCI